MIPTADPGAALLGDYSFYTGDIGSLPGPSRFEKTNSRAAGDLLPTLLWPDSSDKTDMNSLRLPPEHAQRLSEVREWLRCLPTGSVASVLVNSTTYFHAPPCFSLCDMRWCALASIIKLHSDSCRILCVLAKYTVVFVQFQLTQPVGRLQNGSATCMATVTWNSSGNPAVHFHANFFMKPGIVNRPASKAGVQESDVKRQQNVRRLQLPGAALLERICCATFAALCGASSCTCYCSGFVPVAHDVHDPRLLKRYVLLQNASKCCMCRCSWIRAPGFLSQAA
jgi:hypothetical protein